MSEGLSQREKRALMRRRRLEANANQRIDSIFTGSGLSAPPRPTNEEETPTEELTAPPITPPRTRKNSNPSPAPEESEPPSPPVPVETSQPATPEPAASPSPAVKRKPSDRPARMNNQYYKEAQASMAKAQKRAAAHGSSTSPRLWTRMLVTLVHAILFHYLRFDSSVVVSLLVCDISIALWAQRGASSQSALPFLRWISTAMKGAQMLQNLVRMIAFFIFCVVLISALCPGMSAIYWD